MRDISLIVVHCSATEASLEIGAKEIDSMHRQRGFTSIGYHLVIRHNGVVEKGRPIEKVGAHAKGYNGTSVGVCYVGGLKNGVPTDTRTPQQRLALASVIQTLKSCFPKARVVGHRDLSPDKNKDGVISRDEWVKMCPCFDAKEEFA